MPGIALFAALKHLIYDGDRRGVYFVLCRVLLRPVTAANSAGLCRSFGLLSAWLFWKAPRQTVMAYLPAAALVLVGCWGRNILAHALIHSAVCPSRAGPQLV